MFFHILFRELNADREDTDSEDDTGKFEGDSVDDCFITIAPTARIEDIGTIGTYNTRKGIWSVTAVMVSHGSISETEL